MLGAAVVIRVMHVIDSLVLSGAEMVAVTLANSLPTDQYHVHLCASRAEGPLRERIEPHVQFLSLKRRHRFDVAALQHFIHYLQQHDIQIIHAHSSSLFISLVSALRPPHARIIWHDHFGRYMTEQRPAWLYRLALSRTGGVISVNQPLAAWAREAAHVPSDRVWYIPNFVTLKSASDKQIDLPGTSGYRMVCVANLRPQKDHFNLLAAMQHIIMREPRAHLLIIGGETDIDYARRIKETINDYKLQAHVSLLGQRQDVADILDQCDIGVLSSQSEGLPLSLLEYGTAGLAAVATDVGQCAEVLDEGRVGLLVPKQQPEQLADALITLLASSEKRHYYSRAFQQFVADNYSKEAIIQQITTIYDRLLQEHRSTRSSL